MSTKRFAISWVSCYDNELHSEIVTADTLHLAHREALKKMWYPEGELVDTIAAEDTEALLVAAWDTDGLINAIEIPEL